MSADPIFLKELSAFLTPLPPFQDEPSRRALLINAGFSDLLAQISCGGTTANFVPIVVNYLANYGTRADGRHALAHLLEEVARNVGNDKQARIQEFLAKLQPTNNISQFPPTATIPPEQTTAYRYDIFLSHHNNDKAQIGALALWLKNQGVAVWFDAWNLVPGLPWQEGIEEGILQSRSMAIFVGASGLGQWEIPEMRAAIQLYVERQSPVVPIFLPGCPADITLPLLLQRFVWIDFRNGMDDTDTREKLLAAIRTYREIV
ncbi:GUN4 domain protein [Candidatus Moduliflexus flocculans]|uniref:GUN4 domain protein n=1 Tax=Candidatus Moduliflexus flocculans TaxID=1499966 RepID=A0A0S6VT01_9BACT|nr:GUN4 domain protein [Candidatus Moduliflexus flocculans]